jgi:hypothetical protein
MGKVYDVTIARYGFVRVVANSDVEAMQIAREEYSSDEIKWSDDWEPTDATEADANITEVDNEQSD